MNLHKELINNENGQTLFVQEEYIIGRSLEEVIQ